MGKADNPSMAARAEPLDKLWERGDALLMDPRTNRPKIDEIVVEMTDHLNELLQDKVYITNPEQTAQYAELEDLMVKTIARLMKLSYSTGKAYEAVFFEHHRSLRAQYLLKLHGVYARLAAYFDPSRQ